MLDGLAVYALRPVRRSPGREQRKALARVGVLGC